jgi:uncharacterized OsmC-like protein
MEGTAIMDLRERQQPLKDRYRQDPASALLVHSVHSRPRLDDPTFAEITNGTQSWEVAAHAMAGGSEGMACSGDVLLAALAACQEITLKMVASSMGIEIRQLRVTVTGEMDFRGTMGIDRDIPVGYQRIECEIRLQSSEDPARLERLVAKAEQYCVVRATLAKGVPVNTQIIVEGT